VAEELLCPGCGTPSHFDEFRRSANEFCRKCDYPLFWARTSALVAAADGGEGDTGLRRLPGAAGHVAIATKDCWSCREPNLLAATLCIRCGVDLSGPPTPVVVPPPVTVVVEPPPPPPPPPKAPIWPWVVLAVLFVVGLVLLLVLL
jgi:hypothetical protein